MSKSEWTLIPGINNNGTTFLYHSDSMEWEVLPDMPTPRVGLACAMVHNAAGEQEGNSIRFVFDTKISA